MKEIRSETIRVQEMNPETREEYKEITNRSAINLLKGHILLRGDLIQIRRVDHILLRQDRTLHRIGRILLRQDLILRQKAITLHPDRTTEVEAAEDRMEEGN